MQISQGKSQTLSTLNESCLWFFKYWLSRILISGVFWLIHLMTNRTKIKYQYLVRQFIDSNLLQCEVTIKLKTFRCDFVFQILSEIRFEISLQTRIEFTLQSYWVGGFALKWDISENSPCEVFKIDLVSFSQFEFDTSSYSESSAKFALRIRCEHAYNSLCEVTE